MPTGERPVRDLNVRLGARKMPERVGRREFVRSATAGALAAAVGVRSVWGATAYRSDATSAPTPRSGKYALPPLAYGYDALEPFLSRRTLELHHDKHHQGYVNGLNGTLEKLAAAREAGDYGAITALSRDLAFHGSGHVLHSLYWSSMTPGGKPLQGELAAAVRRDFGSQEAFLAQFEAACKAAEGSGWGIVAHEPLGGKVLVLQAEKHQNLAIWGATPLLVCDVWEHAYYVDYANRRADYVAGFLGVADWDSANRRYALTAGP
jgi:Fe-Mn family superoxide dismutase